MQIASHPHTIAPRPPSTPAEREALRFRRRMLRQYGIAIVMAPEDQSAPATREAGSR